MSAQPIEELAVPYDSSIIADKVAHRRRLVRSRLISLVITIIVMIVIYLWRRDELTGAGFVTIYAVVISISVGLFVLYLVRYLLAKRELARVGTGVAVRIGRAGVEVAGSYANWSDVVALSAVKARLGRSPALQLARRSGAPASVPFDQIDVRPATLDSTARAYSGGRHGVDLEALEN